LHQGEHVARAVQHLQAFITGLVAEAAEAGEVRDDIDPGELASYCLHALTAANRLPSEAAARRLVTVTLDGLRPAPAHDDTAPAGKMMMKRAPVPGPPLSAVRAPPGQHAGFGAARPAVAGPGHQGEQPEVGSCPRAEDLGAQLTVTGRQVDPAIPCLAVLCRG